MRSSLTHAAPLPKWNAVYGTSAYNRNALPLLQHCLSCQWIISRVWRWRWVRLRCRYTVICNPVVKQTPVLTNYELYDLVVDPFEVQDK